MVVMALIDLDLKRNINNIRPYLGIMLVGSIAIGFALIISSALRDLSQVVCSPGQEGAKGTLTVKPNGTLYYGDTISYKTDLSGVTTQGSTLYVTTVCYQGDTMVFQKTLPEGESVYFYDQLDTGFEWDGTAAQCTASLVYREQYSSVTKVDIVATQGFEVKARKY